jgi:hypothetical protein
MTTTKAAGRTITAGEMVDHFIDMDPVEPVRISVSGDVFPIEEIQGQYVCGPTDDHPYQDAHNLLEDLHEFSGTKKEMLRLIAQYFTS